MNVIETLKKRKLSLVGFILILISIEGFVHDRTVIVSVPPQLGSIAQIKPFLKEELATKELPKFLLYLYKWPYLTTAIIGSLMIGFDMRQMKKEVI